MLSSAANDTIHLNVVVVGGAVPRAGFVSYEKGMTIETAVSKAGLELRQFSKDHAADQQACPIRVILCRKGTIATYDPKIDAEVLRTRQVLPADSVEIKDLRTIPITIADRRMRLSQMIESGSWEIRDEMQRIDRLQHEYAPLKMGCENWPESVDSYVAKEVDGSQWRAKAERQSNY